MWLEKLWWKNLLWRNNFTPYKEEQAGEGFQISFLFRNKSKSLNNARGGNQIGMNEENVKKEVVLRLRLANVRFWKVIFVGHYAFD